MNNSILIYGFTILVSTMLIAMGIYFLKNQQRNALRIQQITGFNAVTRLRELLSHVQQHRGISNGLLNGDTSLTARLTPLTAKVSNNIARINLEFKASVFDEQLQPLSRWTSITEHWSRLSIKTEQLTSANNLQQHNKLILNILYFIDDIAERHQIYKIVDAQGESVRHMWLELLFTAENIGQIRAIGTGVAAAEKCTSVERIRLNYLCHSLQQSLEDGIMLENSEQIRQLLQVVVQQITITVPSITAEEFFNLASACVEQILQEFDKQLQQFEQDIMPKNANLAACSD
ncbi:MAG: nitrate- and nitrite sensing domain-containing protein [Moritella sp.]|uniref:nitrate- and nitrite sensing domain-containing protein n=1 Tax=Moritella sp. TaxID=78556 RepID=UPI0029B42B65|nr:nitrate- and nitrite sensing domain-containing protein [Moritella sp.]MDX2321737.1 nitrate- and nitrite sensing domain-containing protein [Moritella sp.]